MGIPWQAKVSSGSKETSKVPKDNGWWWRDRLRNLRHRRNRWKWISWRWRWRKITYLQQTCICICIYIYVCVTCDRLDLCTTSRSFKIILLQVPHWPHWPHWLHRSRSQRPGPVLIMIEYDWTIKIHWKAYHVRIVPVCAVAAPISPWWQPDRRHIWILHIEKLKKKHMWECRPSEAVGDWFSIYLSIFLSIFLSLSLSLFLSVCLSLYLSPVHLQAWKPRNSARLFHVSKLTTSKTKQFRETPLIFEFDNIKNKWILRDFLQKWKVECKADSLVPMRFAICPLHLSKVLRLPRKIDARSYEMLHLSHKIILQTYRSDAPKWNHSQEICVLTS